MKAAIYRCDNDHLRIYSIEEAILKLEESTGHTVFGLPRKIGKCPVMANDRTPCAAELRLFGLIEVESPL